MIVVSYLDFASDTQKYLDLAKVSGIKVKPEKKASLSRKQQKILNDLDAITGIVPSDIDFEALKTEEILKH